MLAQAERLNNYFHKLAGPLLFAGSGALLVGAAVCLEPSQGTKPADLIPATPTADDLPPTDNTPKDPKRPYHRISDSSENPLEMVIAIPSQILDHLAMGGLIQKGALRRLTMDGQGLEILDCLNAGKEVKGKVVTQSVNERMEPSTNAAIVGGFFEGQNVSWRFEARVSRIYTQIRDRWIGILKGDKLTFIARTFRAEVLIEPENGEPNCAIVDWNFREKRHTRARL